MLRVNSINFIVIQDESRSKFFNKVKELLLSPPEWVSHYIQIVRQTLDNIPSEESSPYHYAPKYSYNGIKIEFECTRNSYKLSLEKEVVPIESALQLLRSTDSNTASNTQHENKFLLEKVETEKHSKIAIQPHEVVYSGPVNLDSISKFPSDLQSHASKLAQSHFPYTTTIDSDGSVKVGGSITSVGKKIKLKDLLKELEDSENI